MDKDDTKFFWDWFEANNRDEARLIQAIKDVPGNTVPRTIYADWLEEQGRIESAQMVRLGYAPLRLPYLTSMNPHYRRYSASSGMFIPEDFSTSLVSGAALVFTSGVIDTERRFA